MSRIYLNVVRVSCYSVGYLSNSLVHSHVGIYLEHFIDIGLIDLYMAKSVLVRSVERPV